MRVLNAIAVELFAQFWPHPCDPGRLARGRPLTNRTMNRLIHFVAARSMNLRCIWLVHRTLFVAVAHPNIATLNHHALTLSLTGGS